MYAGQIVEQGPTDSVLLEPLHAYTRLLLSAVPHPEREGFRTRRSAPAPAATSATSARERRSLEERPDHFVRRQAA